MSSGTALFRSMVLLAFMACGFGCWILSTVELYLKYAFDGDQAACALYLAYRATANGGVRIFTNNIAGKMSDRLGRKPFFLLSAFMGSLALIMHAPAAKGGWLKIWGWIVIVIDVFSGMFGQAFYGYLKDIVPDQTFNDIDSKDRSKGGQNTGDGRRHWGSFETEALNAVVGTSFFVLGVVISIVVLAVGGPNDGLWLNFIVGGAFVLAGGVWTIFMIPESIDPNARSASSVREYFSSGEWRKDANPLQNIGDVLKQGWLVKVWLACFVFMGLSDAVASISVQYLYFRYGATSITVGFLFVVGIVATLLGYCCSVPCAKGIGETPFAMYRIVVPVGIGGCIFMICNNTLVGYVPWAIVVGIGGVGQIVMGSWTRRMVPYNMQATTAAVFISVGNLSTLCLRVVYALLFIHGLETTDLPDLSRAQACDDHESDLLKWCEADGGMSKSFPCYGAACEQKGADVLYESSQAFVNDGWALTNVTCDVNAFEAEGEEWCACPFKMAKCPKAPPMTQSQGGAGDIISAPFFLSGSLSVVCR